MSYGYITKLPESVTRKHVRFPNRYGLAIAGDLYAPEALKTGKTYPAIIIGAPYGGVKEQGPCVYAGEMAKRGFICLTFDQVYMGESGGEPRHVSSPDLFAESFSAAVDYLGTRVPCVDRERIGVIGICGSGGFALSAASVDVRIKAIATASMYDISDVRGMMHPDASQLYAMKKAFADKRWEDAARGEPEYISGFPETPYPSVEALPEKDPISNEWDRFYAVPRGHHPNARGGFTTTSNLSMLQFRCLDYIEEISPRPILFLAGDIAHSRSFSERAYDLAAEPKELYLVKDAEHIDLYDDVTKIPFDKLEAFFQTNL